MHLTTTKFGAAAALALLAGPVWATEISIPFSAANFPNPLNISNQYWPQIPGEEFFYKAQTADGCEWSHVRVAPQGSGEEPTKQIHISGATLTVRTVADFQYEDEVCDGPDPEELVEKTFDWYGQDNAGNVWYFGEDTKNCQLVNDEVVCAPGSGGWEAGVNGANPGIIMLGDPKSGDRYRQEIAVGVAEDWAKVMNLNGHPVLRSDDAVEPGTWNNCLVIKEWSGLDSGSIEHKTYCPEAGGLVLVEEHSGKLVRFELAEDGASDASVEPDALTFRVVPKN